MTAFAPSKLTIHKPTLWTAFRLVFSRWPYRILALVTVLAFFLLSLYVPVMFIPASTLSFVLHSIQLRELIVLVTLSVSSGLLAATNAFLIKRRVSGVTTVEGGFGLAAAFSAAVLLTSCGCGLGLIVGIFGIGLGGTAFLTTHQFTISLVALAVMLIGLYISLRKVNAVCAV